MTGVPKDFGGCTAELGAIMCEAYNKKLVASGGEDLSKHCIGFVLLEAPFGLGDPKKKTYKKTFDYDMLIGFFSSGGGESKYNNGKN